MKNLKMNIARLITVTALLVAGRAQAQTSATLIDYGSSAPASTADDQAQLTSLGYSYSPDGLNYYFDNRVPPGQTFMTGTSPNGYVLDSLFIGTSANGGSLPAGGQAYTLRLYSMLGNTATLIATYQSQTNVAFTEWNWLQWTNLGLGLQPNARYAYSLFRNSVGWENLASMSGNPYADGELALIPAAGGTVLYGSSHDYDATFLVHLKVASKAIANPISISPANPVSAGTTAILSTAPAIGPAPLYCQWRTDGGSGRALTNIPGATSTNLAVNTAGFSVGVNYRFALVVTNSSSAATSSVAVLNVALFSGATLTDSGTEILPTPDDISQLTSGGNGDGLNYYTDNDPAPGQVFTTGTNSLGYTLKSVIIGTGGGTVTGATTPQNYRLYVYSVSNNIAAIIATFTNAGFSFTYGDWLTWSGFPALTLNPNSTYAYAFRRLDTGWAGLASTPTNTDLYTGGQMCLVPAGGGTITYGTSGHSDAAFSVGLQPVGVPPSPYPYAGVIAVSPSKVVSSGTLVTLSVAATGNTPLVHQWRTDGGGGGSLTNIPGANATNLVLNTAGWIPKPYRYDVVVTNSVGSATSLVATVSVLYTNATALLQDIGGADPLPLPANDVAQMLAGGGAPDGLNYWNDNVPPPGQTFVTGSNSGGYIVTSLAIRVGDGSMGGLPEGGQPYVLRLYTVSGSTAALLAVYTSQTNSTFGYTNWLRWSGFALPLSPSTTYAYSFSRLSTGSGWVNMSSVSNSPYAGGELAMIPESGGPMTLGSSHGYDGTFIVGLVTPGKPIVSPPLLSATTIYAGSSVAMSAAVSGTGPFTYVWQTDGGNNGVMTNIPGAIATNLSRTLGGNGDVTIGYRLLASNGSGTTTGEVATVTVLPASAPILVTDTTPASAVKFVGGSVALSASFIGTEPIHYQWQANKGDGPTNFMGKTSSTLTLTNLALGDSGEYSLYAYNTIGANQSTPAVLTVYPIPAAGMTVNFRWYSTEGGDVGAYYGAGVTGFGSGSYWNMIYGPPTWTPGTYTSSSGLTDDGATDTGFSLTIVTDGSWSQTSGSTISLLDSYAITYETRTFFFNVPNGRYDLALFSCNGNEAVTSTNAATAFTVNGVTRIAAPTQHSSFAQGDNYVVFSNVTVTNGTLYGTWSVANGLSLGSLNGAQIRYLGAAIPLQTLAVQRSGDQLTLSWPSAGWTLQAQTNLPGRGLGTNWVNVPGSSSTNSFVTPVSQTAGSVFYRLILQ
jgi:hypothetical protein